MENGFARSKGLNIEDENMSAAEMTLNEVLDAFDFKGSVTEAKRYGQGHINDTFKVCTAQGNKAGKNYILQRMSAAAFKQPDHLMTNIIRITEYLSEQISKEGGDICRECMNVIRPKNGADYYTDSLGGAWRVFCFIEDTHCFQNAESPELFAAAGKAFGRFQRMLSNYPAENLYETIPDFHNTEKRLEALKEAIRRDSLGRVLNCREEIGFALQREKDCSVALNALRAGILPLRVTHNDTKLNNVLFDIQTGEGICVIDLDTVMPGLSIYDFGDSIRFGANHCEEDETDLTRVALDTELFAVYAAAYLEGAGGALTEHEIEYLPWGAKLMTLECGIRFLTDYLMGDVYFHTSRPAQNLDRARTQFRLVGDMEDHWNELEQIVSRLR